MEELFKFLNSLTPISDKAWNALKDVVVRKSYPAKTYIIKIGDKPRKVCFLEKGYVRGYVLTTKNKEFNREIFGPAEFISSLSTLMQGGSSKLGIQALTESIVYCVNFNTFMRLVGKHSELAIVYRKSLEINFIKLEQRIIQLSTTTATERYIEVRERMPNIDNLIAQYHIASYLGITPIQLSRIRSKLFSS